MAVTGERVEIKNVVGIRAGYWAVYLFQPGANLELEECNRRRRPQ